MTISTIVLAITEGGAAGAPSPTPKPSGGVEWVKKHLQALGWVLAKIAGKAAAALHGIIGSLVSWPLSTLGKATLWLAENLWAAAVLSVGLIIAAVRRVADRRVYQQSTTMPMATPAVTRAAFSSSWSCSAQAVACYFVVVPVVPSEREQQQHRSLLAARQVPCEQSRLVGRLVYTWVVADSRVLPGDYDRYYSPERFPNGAPYRSVLSRARSQRRSPRGGGGGLMHTATFSSSVRCSPRCRRERQWHLRHSTEIASGRRTPSRP